MTTLKTAPNPTKTPLSSVRTDADGSHGAGDESGGSLLGHIWASIGATIVLGLICCGLYPLIVYGIGQLVFPNQANGSLVTKDGQPTTDDTKAVGSYLIGQTFTAGQYFHPRPSAAGNGYDATSSGGTNLGPLSAKLIHGTTKLYAYTVFAAEKPKTIVVPVTGRVQGTVAEATKTTITVTAADGKTKTTYTLDPAVADPNTVVNYHARTVHATTIPVGAIVELTLNDKTPAAVTAINVADQENDAGIVQVDTVANKITLDDSGATVLNIDPKATAYIVNGKSGAALTDLKAGMTLHAVVAVQMDFDGINDRVIHFCQDNNIAYKSTVPDTAFVDADGLDDVKLITAFNAATTPTITPSTLVPADAVTASGSGLDPHISPANAALQAQRVADARKITKDKVMQLIAQNTDNPNLGFLGDPGVNVLMLNIALDKTAPMPAPASAPAASAAAPESAPAATAK